MKLILHSLDKLDTIENFYLYYTSGPASCPTCNTFIFRCVSFLNDRDTDYLRFYCYICNTYCGFYVSNLNSNPLLYSLIKTLDI